MDLGTYVLVTTSSRGVFAGVLKSNSGDRVTLTEARNCIYWSRETRGFLGLAERGPQKGSRVGPAVPEIELLGVTAMTRCTPEARKAWEAQPWS